MNGKQILAIKHGKEIGPGSVLGLLGIVKEDVHPLMVFLQLRREDSPFMLMLLSM